MNGGQVGEAPPSQVWAPRQVREREVWVVLRIFRGRRWALGARAWVLQRGARQSVVAKELVQVHPMCEPVLLLVPPMPTVAILPLLVPSGERVERSGRLWEIVAKERVLVVEEGRVWV